MRIQQHATFLMSMVQRVKAGSLAPAAFQRPYVWSRADVMALCTSILEAYPIGGFLSWAPGPAADVSALARHRLGPIVLETSARAPALLLDGQNRLATLAWLLHDFTTGMPTDLSDKEQETWATGEELIVDMETKELRFVKHANAAEGFSLPAAAMFDSRVANTLIRARWERNWKDFSEDQKDAGLKWLDHCADCFREARIVETVLENATPAEARKAFLHICRVGVPMDQADFDKAIGWTE